MPQSDAQMSSLLAELAGEATQKLEAKRSQQQDRQEMMRRVHEALERTVQFFTLFCKHLNAIEPAVQRNYVLDGKTCFSDLQWKNGMISSRKQSLADDALLEHAHFQVRLISPATVEATRRWEKFDEFRAEVQAYGLKPKVDLEDLWRDRKLHPMLKVELEPELLLWIRFQSNYVDGNIDVTANNLEGFGKRKASLPPDALPTSTLEEVGRYLMGRVNTLPEDFKLERDLSNVLANS
ncbi:MAG: hypothetical protein PHP05_01380 [Sideroxydans sp.]|nr:hypothetical protein [Sideroxydans sp.]